MTTKTMLNKRETIAALHRLADYVTDRQLRAQQGYDQRKLLHTCGTPACLWGHARWLYRHEPGALGDLQLLHLERSLEERMPVLHHRYVDRPRAHIYSLWSELCSTHGCGDARNDWRAAVEYVRAVCEAMAKSGVGNVATFAARIRAATHS